MHFASSIMNMKKLFESIRFVVGVVFVLVLMALPPATSAQESNTSLRFDPQNIEIPYGGWVDVAVILADATELYGIDVLISYDPAHIEIVDVDSGTEGVQIAPGVLPQPDFVVRNIADNAAGTLRYAVTQVSPTPIASGTGVVFTLRVRGTGASEETAFMFDSVQLASPDGLLLPADYSPGFYRVATGTSDESVTIGAPTQSPASTPAATVATATVVAASTVVATPSLQATQEAIATQVTSVATAAPTPSEIATVSVEAIADSADQDSQESANSGLPTVQAVASADGAVVQPSTVESALDTNPQDDTIASAESISTRQLAEAPSRDDESSAVPQIIGADVVLDEDGVVHVDPDQSATDNVTTLVSLGAIVVILMLIVFGWLILSRRRTTK
jgi:hypothetical protein